MIGFSFFVDELTKEAGSDYYQRNRDRILAKQRMYRSNNKHSIARRQKIYRRKVKSGSQRQRTRQRVGHSFVYTGYR
jgi:hypothetical protein